jgi:site-specific DNA recombinase
MPSASVRRITFFPKLTAAGASFPENYDDGGFSGGNIERPALKRMMDDIQNGRIDIVVVYKVDRISRSLMDFYDLLKVFEKHGVEFVSVTQNFDTSQPMGKLMLNMLLSFAQFEREVIRERILDKFELSKQKGIFMGGSLPLGYRVESRKLYIVRGGSQNRAAHF